LATECRIYVIDAYTSHVTLLAPIFNADRLIIGHNLKFDLKMLAAAGLPWHTGPVFNTMLAAQLLGAGTPEGRLSQSGLAAVVERYLHFQVAKTEQRSDWSASLSPQQLHYAAVDAGML